MERQEAQAKHQHWSSRATFILAAVGSAVGLGNFWRFPYTAGENGGAAFIVVYLFCILLIGLPVLIGEYMIGRNQGMSAVGSTREIGRENRGTGIWVIAGWVGMLASFLLLTYYSVIAGWVVAFIYETGVGNVAAKVDLAKATADQVRAVLGTGTVTAASIPAEGIGGLTAEYLRGLLTDLQAAGPVTAEAFADAVRREAASQNVGELFTNLTSNPWKIVFFHTLFMAITGAIVARGLKGGIEVAANFLMPAFFVMLLIMVGYSFLEGDVNAAIDYLFKPDFSELTPNSYIAALGQALFSLGVGGAIMITYGAYLNKDTNLPGSAGIVAGADTIVALVAGLAIFPVVFAIGLSPQAGPGLIFTALPVALADFPAARLVGSMFFVLAFFAALTSSMSLLEIVASWAEEHRGIARPVAAIGGAFVAWVIGLFAALSYNVFSLTNPGKFIAKLEGSSAPFFDLLDFIVSDIGLPMGALLAAIVAGWVVKTEVSKRELRLSGPLYMTWLIAIRFIAPTAIVLIFITGMYAALTGGDLVAVLFG